MDSSDVEKGMAASSQATMREQRLQSVPSYFSGGGSGGGKAPRDDLEIFQTLVGIRFLVKGGASVPESERTPPPANPLLDIFNPSKTGQARFRNRGLYDRALSQDLKYRVLYTASHYVIFSLYIWQVLMAATITAISAYHSTASVPLTILGALNTIIAGLQAWLSGQGMPVRFRRARDQFRELVKEIETAERMFAEADFISWPDDMKPRPVDERNRLERKFEEARLDLEGNYPDVHVSASANQAQAQNVELKDQVEKWRDHGTHKAQELDKVRKELETLKDSMKGAVKRTFSHHEE